MTPVSFPQRASRRFSGRSFLPAFLLLSQLALSSCTVGPDYHAPKLRTPRGWSEPLAGGETNGLPDLAAWWKRFQDPELDSLVERAVKVNLSLRVAEARVREARAQQAIASGAWWPSADATASYTRSRISGNYFLPLPPGTPLGYNFYQAGFDASWEIDIFGGTRRAVEAARAETAAAEFNRRDVVVSLLAELARNYFEARTSQQRLVILRQNLSAQQDSLKLSRERYQAGLASQLDVEQATALLAATQAELPALETALESSIHALEVLLAQLPGALKSELSNRPALPSPPPQVPVGLPSELLLRRPDILRAERQLAASTARIGVARADLFPRFSLTGNGGLQSVSLSDWFSPGSRFWSAGPSLTWRIFDAGRIRANIRVQNARQEQALASYEQVALAAFADAENALTAYAKEQVRLASLSSSVTAERAALHLAQDLYRNGLADFLRVLDSERTLYQAEDALVQSRRNVSEDLVRLYKALGGGWESIHVTRTERPPAVAAPPTATH